MCNKINQTVVKVSKDMISNAMTRRKALARKMLDIEMRLEKNKVVVTKWFGLKKVTMTEDEHILSLRGGMMDFTPYALRATQLGYITEEEYALSKKARYLGASMQDLQAWMRAEEVYLGKEDYTALLVLLED